MLSLFEKEPYFEIVNRLNQLTPETKALWGKMNVAQMLAHCTEPFRVPLNSKKTSRSLMGLVFGGMAKKMILGETPYKKSLPTSKSFIIKDDRDFFLEKQNLMTVMAKFYSGGPNNLATYSHPFLGNLTGEQWGISMHKHLDHHLQQFGV